MKDSRNRGTGRAARAVARAVGQVALGAVFVQGGNNVWRDPDMATTRAAEFLARTKKRVPALAAFEDRQLVRFNAAIHLGAGLGLATSLVPRLATGLVPRVSALLIAGSLVPTTLSVFSYWTEPPGPDREFKAAQFMKNVSLAGGLVAVAIARD